MNPKNQIKKIIQDKRYNCLLIIFSIFCSETIQLFISNLDNEKE